jgi:4-diphosphocytidyl-2-C-methyl-D-erythritol kinase
MRSYAKINLGLNILNKREDGFHNLETLFVPIDLYDTLEVSQTFSGIQIETKNDKIPKDESNICYKAAKLLQEFFNNNFGVSIEINKKIPVGAGLGGGSSNGALVLKEIVKNFGLDISEKDLSSIGLKLGSDVPYFLKDGIAYAKGRGEILEYFDVSIPYWILVVYPNLSISTKWAYENLKEKENPVEFDYKKLLLENLDKPDILKKTIKNDFENNVFVRFPGLINIKNLLNEKDAVYSSLSGSGSCLYGFFDSKKNVDRAFDSLSTKFKVFITEPDFKINTNN